MSQIDSSKYLKEDQDFPYCMGCGHTMINKALANAFAKSGLKPSKINLISDIGCVGLVDKMFLTNTIHTTHGRSTAFATGIQLADELLYDNDALNVVMIGDGGATIGLLHLVEAAKMNANITVVLHNNFVYGMTGGQNSGLTPENFRTATTLSGSLVPNIHIAKLLEASYAGFIARKLATDRDLDAIMLEAFNYKGFALIEIVELCTGYATKWNSLSKKDIEKILENSDQEDRGVLVKNDIRTFSEKYQETFKAKDQYRQVEVLETESKNLDLKTDLVLVGTAGEGIQFASASIAKTFVKAGLNISQKNDNPVTIGTGYSLSELKVSTDEIYYTAIDKADYVLISSQDGLNRIKKEIHPESVIIADASLELSGIKAKQIISLEARSMLKDKRLSIFVLIKRLFQELELDEKLLINTLKENPKTSEDLLNLLEK